ncbi:hypothetical protein FRB94_000568 [Tulasnella sp. JGI-2019a]|nr:hypothetical protein FRB94_000568 [Tulasnella sp. JGI-2019a]
MSTPDPSWNALATETQADVVLTTPLWSPQVHPKYNDELVGLIIGRKVENRIYRVSKLILSQSAPFSAVLRSYLGGQLVSLTSVSTSEFESFLEVLHARQIEAPLRLQPAEWSDALYLSTRWGFSAVREHVIAEIEDQCDDQGPLDRFELALKCRVSQWLRPVYHALCSRNEHITAEEGRRLGYERLTAICRIREVLRGKSQPNSINDQCWRCEYCYTNRPCRFPLEASGEDTLEWIDKAEHLQASFDGMEEEIGVAISAPLPRIVPENPDKRDSAITASIPVRNIGDSVETIPSIPLRSQAEDMQVAFNMVTEVPRPSPPIIVISGDPYTSTQTALSRSPRK